MPTRRCSNAGRLVAEGGVGSVKLEGGAEFAETIERHRPRRHPGDGPPRASRRSRCTRWAATWCRAATRSTARKILARRARARAGRLLRAGARGRPAGAGASRSPRAAHPHHRHRRRRRTATARCWSATTCFGINPDFKPKFVKRYADLYGVHHAARPRRSSPRCAAATFPDDEHSFTSKTSALRAAGTARAASAPTQADEPRRSGPIYGVPV